MLSVQEVMRRDINSDVAKEAYSHAEKRLSDLLEAKKNLETKASSLLTAFTTLSLALMGAGGAFFTNAELVKRGDVYLPIVLFAAAVPLIYSAWCMMRALVPADYGTLGSDPSMWVIDGLIDSKVDAVPWALTIIVIHMRERISKTMDANSAKASYISIGASSALMSPLLLALSAVPAILGACASA